MNQILEINLQLTSNVASGNSRLHEASDWSYDLGTSWTTSLKQERGLHLQLLHAWDEAIRGLPHWLSCDQSEVWWSLEFPDAKLPVRCKFISSIWFNFDFISAGRVCYICLCNRLLMPWPFLYDSEVCRGLITLISWESNFTESAAFLVLSLCKSINSFLLPDRHLIFIFPKNFNIFYKYWIF